MTIGTPSAWKARLHSAAESRFASALLLLVLFYITAAAAHSGFIGKWALRDPERTPVSAQAPDGYTDPFHMRYGFEEMLNGTAHKPWVYRQLVPAIANTIDRAVSPAARASLASLFETLIGPRGLNELSPSSTFTRAYLANQPSLRFRYLIVYYLSFLSLLGALYALRRILLHLGAQPLVAVLAPVSFLLALPYIQTIGGYFYDNTELFFMALCFLAALRGRLLWLTLLVALATLNKETFIFFIPALYPLLRNHSSKQKALNLTVALFFLSGLANVALKLAYQDNPGVAGWLQLRYNLETYLSFWSYRRIESTYGLVGPSRFSLATILLVSLIAWRGWSRCPDYLRHHLKIAAALNFPLLLLFCTSGELRNLSLLFTGFVVLIANALERHNPIASSSRT